MTWTYRSDAETPSYAVHWKDRDGNTIDFSSGYTFTVQLVNVSTGTTALTKTTNITGASTSPNVTVAWAVGELAVTAGLYWLMLKATDGSSQDRFFRPGNWPTIEIEAAP
jgi:cytochrome bd-type quinol oxidase subunit 2